MRTERLCYKIIMRERGKSMLWGGRYRGKK